MRRCLVLTAFLLLIPVSAHADPPPSSGAVNVWAAANAAVFVQRVNEYAWASALAAKERAAAEARPARVRPTRSSAAHGDRQACIIARENGGSYGRSSNPTHFGAYQFDRQTWAANGGDPATWGSASPAEQDQVFNNTVAAHGYSAWAPYDGC